ncbi:ATP-grasp domain-containing protein [Flagellimonas iocasae]|uniref:RimK family alpha-L-glutamate ligase n=1 Tax=Flagellimonas iocasae TaxID=2055905 RepID=A0ABW4XSJ1_9FLAO
MNYDVVVLTDPRYINPTKQSAYIDNVLLEDRLVLEGLQKEGLKAIRKSWDDPDFDWSTTKYALFRTTWDYFDRFPEFSKWLECTSRKTQFINSKKLIYWNIDKHYLRDLSLAGVTIPKTYFVEQGTQISLKEAYLHAVEKLEFRPSTFIIKPCVSGAARHTYKIQKDSIDEYEDIFQKLISEEAMMLQEFQENIVKEGEISMMVFNGQVTHAVLKIAKPGDFRVQDDFGGTVHSFEPTTAQIDFATRVVHAAPELPMYARVDMFKDNDGNWALAELEIFEPELWFRLNPAAAEILAKSIKDTYFSMLV